MKFQGTITQWDDAKGFGFIAADGGDARIFFHHSDLQRGAPRPTPGLRVAFGVETGPKGKRATTVTASSLPSKPIAPARRVQPSRGQRPEPNRRTSILPLLAFAGMWVPLTALASPPPWAGPIYLAMSVLTFLVYALDKSAARRGGWRTQETTLHALALLGGWPGALLAQKHLRHKNQKASFQTAYWATVVVNLAVLLTLSTAWGRSLLAAA